MNFSFKRAEDSPGFLLWQLTNQWQRQQRAALAKIGLTHAQFVVLASALWLNNISEQAVSQQTISEHSKIDKMSMSDLVATLIRKKLLSRSPHKHDGRSYSITLTPKGQALVLKAIPIVEGIDAEFFSPNTPNLIQLLTVLEPLFKNNYLGV
jgi:MarR family transcriptional regulator, organic hydroperoxide resistance regulator